MASTTRFFVFICYISILFSCQPSAPPVSSNEDPNPAAEGFNQTESDDAAIALADAIMEAMGGRKAWDDTRFIQWNFFGRRMLYWDKLTGDVRIESAADSTIYLVNILQNEGKVMRQGQKLIHADSIAKYVKRGHDIWINDSYWLVMPFKLKDSGVRLQHLGKDTLQNGSPAEVLQLTFDGVGVTPENKYLLYVDPNKKLIQQWAYYQNAAAEVPRFVTPWAEYKRFGNILLACNRGKYRISDIVVHEHLPDQVFSSFEPIKILK